MTCLVEIAKWNTSIIDLSFIKEEGCKRFKCRHLPIQSFGIRIFIKQDDEATFVRWKMF